MIEQVEHDADDIVDQRSLGDIDQYVNPGTILMIDSYLGTGKTTSYISWVRRYNPRRVIILGPRQLYELSMVNEYNKEDPVRLPSCKDQVKFNCYLDYPGKDSFELYDVDRLVVQVESLFKLQTKILERPYDVLILDEIESILTQFSSPTIVSNVVECVKVFEELVLTTPIICLFISTANSVASPFSILSP